MTAYVLSLASLFAVALAVSIIPGPTNFLLMRISMRQGRWPGVMAALGTTVGCVIWCVAAAIGLAALFAAAPWLYGVLRIAGGLYLLWCAWSLWRAQPTPVVEASAGAGRQAFWAGLAVNMTNPKSVLFFASIFSAYVGPTTPPWVQVAAVGVVTFVCLGWCAGLAWLFSTQAAVEAYARQQQLLDRVAAVLMAAFGVGLLWTST
jgi:RhtB (resistance to homoserine/threonine) family protein